MPPLLLPSYKQQQLLLEFAAIKVRCPDGFYLSPAPKNPTTWSGVFFVRRGPYSSAVLRFELTFSSTYPDSGPRVSFSTEIFHPLLVPLTTYTFAAGALDPNTSVNAANNDRLPPGSFNLRDEFPAWYATENSKRSVASSSLESDPISNPVANHSSGPNVVPAAQNEKEPREGASILSVLQYVKEAFEDAELLDNLPLRAAVNANAWHAWRAHRGLPKLGSRSISPASAESGRTPLSPGRDPGDWNWDGVWESRVRNGIEESMSDATLFGSKNNRPTNAVSSPIRFAKYDEEKTAEIEETMSRALGLASV